METKVQMQESPVQKANRKWEKKYSKVDKKLKQILVWVFGMTAIAFVVPFMIGCLIAYADPDGWPAARVGLMFGGCCALIIFFAGAAGSAIYMSED